jgi:hypothetical protein
LHDFDDATTGYEPYYQMRYVDAQVEVVGPRLRTADVTLVDVASLVPLNAPGGTWAWTAGLRGGTRAPFLHRGAAFGHVDAGVSLALFGERAFVYFLFGGETAVGGGPSELDVTARGGLVTRFSSRVRLATGAVGRRRVVPTPSPQSSSETSPFLAAREAAATLVFDVGQIAPTHPSVASLQLAAYAGERGREPATVTFGFAYKY